MTGGWGGEFARQHPMGETIGNIVASGAGWIAENMGYANVVGLGQEHMLPAGRYAIARAQGFLRAGQQLREGAELGRAGTKEIRRMLRESYAEIARGEGADTDMGDFEEVAVGAVIAEVSELSRRGLGGMKATSGELKAAVRKRLLAQGKSKEVVDRMLDLSWDTGFGQIVLTRAREEGGKTVKAALTETMDSEGFDIAGKSLKEVIKRAKESSEVTRAIVGGMERSIWTGSEQARLSEEESAAYLRYAAKIDPEEMLIRHALALREKADTASDEDSKRLHADAQRMLETAARRMGEDKYDELMTKVKGSRVADEGLKRAITKAAETSAGKTAEQQISTAQTVQKRAQATRRRIAIAKGATRIAEQEGVTMQSVLAREEYRTAEGQQKLFDLGAVEGEEMAVGGRGRGGQAEAATRAQAGQLADLAAQIPKLREASQNLNEAAANLNRSVRASGFIKTKPGK
jgi:hypothetical protein